MTFTIAAAILMMTLAMTSAATAVPADGVSTTCVDNADFVDELAVLLAEAADSLGRPAFPSPPIAWSGTCDEWATFDCGAANSTWGYSQEGQEEIIRNCPAACGQCWQCPTSEVTPLFETFYDVQCLSDMTPTADIPCPLHVAIKYFDKFAGEFRFESMSLNLVLLMASMSLTFMGGVPDAHNCAGNEKKAFFAACLIMVLLMLQLCTMLSAGIMVAWSYAINRQLFSQCMITLNFVATKPNFLDLVVVPTWFLQPSMSCMLAAVFLYSFCLAGVFVQWKVGGTREGAKEAAILTMLPKLCVTGAFPLTIVLNLVYMVCTLLILYSTVFLPISIMLCAVFATIIAVACMMDGAAVACGKESPFDFVAREIENIRVRTDTANATCVWAPIFLPQIIGPSIVLGSVLGWVVYEGRSAERSTTIAKKIMKMMYDHCFALFTEWTFHLPAFSYDADLLAELSDHFYESLLGHDPEELLKVSTGLATLNVVISLIKPVIIFANFVAGKVTETSKFGTLTVSTVLATVMDFSE